MYGAFSPAILMEWVKLFDDEWMDASESISASKAQSYKAAELNTSDQYERSKNESEKFFSNLYSKFDHKPKPNINDNTKL